MKDKTELDFFDWFLLITATISVIATVVFAFLEGKLGI